MISPDLSTNDPAKLGDSGGPIVVDNTAAEFHCTIISIAPSPLDSNVIWVGTDDGNVQVTRDGGKTWTNVFKNVPGLKPNAWIPTVDASHSDVGTAYVAADHHQDDDYSPYAYMTTDFGKTWKSVIGDLPAKAAWVHVVREDPRNKNLLYIGTEMGIWASWDRGAHWTSLRGDLPIVPVRDIQVHPRDNDLLLATHGRGLYILDDITALQQYCGGEEPTTPRCSTSGPPSAGTCGTRTATTGQKQWTGANPPEGALITYYLKTQPPRRGERHDHRQGRPHGAPAARACSTSRASTASRGTSSTIRRPAAGAAARGGRRRGGRAAARERTRRPRRRPIPRSPTLRAQRRAAADEEAPPQGGRGGGGGFGGGGGIFALPGTYTVTLVVEGKRYTKTVDDLARPALGHDAGAAAGAVHRRASRCRISRRA